MTISIITVVVTLGLFLIVSIFYHGSQRRVRLLRAGCLGLFVSLLCHGMDHVYGGPVVDLVMRLAILTAQTCTVLLILTFRKEATTRRWMQITLITSGIIALSEIVLMWFLPVHADGAVFHQSETQQAAELDKAWSLITYHGLYLSAFAAATVVAAIGCLRVLVQKDQPFSARLPVAFFLVGALGTTLFIASALMDLLSHSPSGGSTFRRYLIAVIVIVVLFGLGLGVVRTISISMRKALALRLAREIVMPLWRTTTTLHPDVKLPNDERVEFDQLMELSRLTIETHDALRLIREDDDPALEHLRRRHPEDPHLSARLIRHLSGENAVPSMGMITVALTRLRTLQLADDETLALSVRNLFEIRLAMNAMGAPNH